MKDLPVLNCTKLDCNGYADRGPRAGSKLDCRKESEIIVSVDFESCPQCDQAMHAVFLIQKLWEKTSSERHQYHCTRTKKPCLTVLRPSMIL